MRSCDPVTLGYGTVVKERRSVEGCGTVQPPRKQSKNMSLDHDHLTARMRERVPVYRPSDVRLNTGVFPRKPFTNTGG